MPGLCLKFKVVCGGPIQQSYWTFFVLCFFLTVTPGSDTALVLRSAINSNKKLLAALIAGICSGLLVHATLSSLGLTAVLQSSPQLYSALKYAGAAYLFYLGGRSLYDASFEGQRPQSSGEVLRAGSQKTVISEFRTGLLANVLNPKVAVFYITFLSQFINPEKNIFIQSILLSAGHIFMSIIWLALIGVFVGYFQRHLEKPEVRKTIETLTGLALILFGLRLAFQ